MSQSSAPRCVKCPSCGASVVWGAESAFRPFCSERCRKIDLGAWASESYRVPLAVNERAGGTEDEPH